MAKRAGKYVAEYRRIRKNYLQYIRRHELKSVYEAIKIPEKITKSSVSKIEKEYAKLKKDLPKKEEIKRKIASSRKKLEEAERDAIENALDERRQNQFESWKHDIEIWEEEQEHERQKTEDWIKEVNETEYEEPEPDFQFRPDLADSFPEISPEEPWSRETSRDEEYPWAGEIILDNLREEIANWTPDPLWTDYFAEQKRQDRYRGSNVLESAIAEFGEEAVARNCEGKAERLHYLLDFILYGSEGRAKMPIDTALIEFQAILRSRIPSVLESQDLSEWEYEDDEDGE